MEREIDPLSGSGQAPLLYASDRPKDRTRPLLLSLVPGSRGGNE